MGSGVKESPVAAEHYEESVRNARDVVELHLRLHPHGGWQVDYPTRHARASSHNLRLALTNLAKEAGRRTPIDLNGSTVVVHFEVSNARFQAIIDDVWGRSCACDELERAVTIVREDRLQLCTEDLATLLRVTPSEVRDAFATARDRRS
jgi:hypothetical protein